MTSASLDRAAVPVREYPATVSLFACLVAVLLLIAAFFTDRNGDVDEVAMYNPSYMVAHFGKLTFPTFPGGAYFEDPVIVHPPVHLGLIGLLARFGFTWYYAEAIPTLLFFFLALVVIVRGSFPEPVKLGLLFSIGFIVLTGDMFATFFGTRPEGDVHAGWIAGLLLLESGRLDHWNQAKLFAGAFVLTWASSLHYYAGAAFAGVVVYVVWAAGSLPWKDARSRILALCGGGCLFGIPYLALFLAPNFAKILSAIQSSVQFDQGVRGSVRRQLDLYRMWSHFVTVPALVRIPMKLGVPLFFFSTPVLALVRSTRGLALAALPLQLFVFFFASHKQSPYLVHEIALFATAAGVGAAVLADRFFSLVRAPRFQRLSLPLTALLLFIFLVKGNPTLRAAVVVTKPHVHEADVARAAAREILGPHARVGGRLGAWYQSGAEHWYDVSEELSDSPYDPITYFSNFDAVVEYNHTSDSGSNPISSWYANGSLKLRGFYFGETNVELQTVLLSSRPTPQVVGYGARNGQLYRFEQHREGDYEVLVAACPATRELSAEVWHQRWPGTFSAVLDLRQPEADAPNRLVTVLFARQLPEPAGSMGRSCKEIGKVYGTLLLADREALVDSLRRKDTPMHFYRTLDQMPGYTGVGLTREMTPPKDCVRLDHVLRLSLIQVSSNRARLDRTPRIRLTTVPGLGAFSASIPLSHADAVVTPCWIQLRLKVDHGAIGIAAFNDNTGIVSRTNSVVMKSEEPMDVVLKVASLRTANYVIIFNETGLASQVEVLDAAVLVTQQDWDLHKAVLASVR